MSDCQFENASEPDAAGLRFVRCKRCGFTPALPTSSPLDRCYRNCPKRGLGDYVAMGLAAFGITPKTVGCGGCPERQEALNKIGEKLGL